MRKKFLGESREFYRTVADINNMADKGTSIVCSMGSQKKMPFSLDDLHFIPAQISKIPLDADVQVNTKVVIGPEAERPMIVSSPIMFSGMSYGAVSKRARFVLARVALNLKIGLNSGEDIVLSEIETSSQNLILQYSTVRFGITDEILKKCSAVEIRFGQGAFPGWRSLLPATKVPEETVKLKGLKKGEDEHTPSHHPDIQNKEELREKISWLKKVTGGVPVGAKIGCGDIETDVDLLAECGADFISLDGFGGGTGATEFFVRENVGIPIVAALPRADKYLKKIGKRGKVSIVAGGGLRTSVDFAKCLALGANAVYIGTSALIAINCQQYRICHTGNCPTGVTTNNPSLVQQLDVDEGIRKLTNFVNVSNAEISNLARIVGKDDIRKLELEDLVALKRDLSEVTGVKWLNGKVVS
jgi:glutamate synthase domain-containing protein 2